MKIYGVSSQVVKSSHQVGVQRRSVPIIQGNQSSHFNPPLCQSIQKENSKVACAYVNAQAISFGYKSILKDLFKQGEMPSVTRGLYGNRIDRGTVSIEHLLPHSMGGGDTLSNYALAHVKSNLSRGNNPIAYFLDNKMLEDYLSQFNFEIKGRFNGYAYQDMIRNTCKRLGVSDTKLKLPKSVSIGKPIILTSNNIDYGNMREVIAHLNEIDLSLLPKKMLRSLINRGYIK